MSNDTVVVVGASLAGLRAAETVRRSGHAGRIVLVGEEPEPPYDRPPLSKKFLRGQLPAEKLPLRPEAHYERLKIELELGQRARRLDATARTVELEGGGALSFDRLVVATGASVRRLSCPGAELAGVHYVRTAADSRALREEMKPGRRAVIVGAGVIGAEVAAACREEGLEAVLVDVAEVPLLRAFGPEVGRLYGEIHRARGVELRLGAGVRELRGAGRVEEVVTTAGDRLACDFVVVGIGVSPATDWLAGSGVELDAALGGGVVVDARCRTSVPGIWAAGDVARSFDPRLGRRTFVESIDNAQNQGAAAGANLMGKEMDFAPVPFFWSDQYDLKLQSVGHVEPHDRVVFRGDVAGRAFVAFHLAQGTLRYAIGVNRLKEIAAAKKLIATRCPVAPEALADDAVELSTLLPGP